MNLSEMDDGDAKRIVDFAAGLVVRAARDDRARDPEGLPAVAGQRGGDRRGESSRWPRAVSSTRADPAAPWLSSSRFSLLLLWLFLLTLIARVVIDLLQIFARDFRPSGLVLVLFEVVFTVTDPPLRALRRVIPPVRIGAVAFDLAILVLFIGTQVLIWSSAGLAVGRLSAHP